jgi:hypothetical protein
MCDDDAISKCYSVGENWWAKLVGVEAVDQQISAAEMERMMKAQELMKAAATQLAKLTVLQRVCRLAPTLLRDLM